MHKELLNLLRCPTTGERLLLEQAIFSEDRIQSGWLVAEQTGQRFAIRDFIPRFVPESNYTDNFGMQWNMFRTTQLDSYSGHPISANRFWTATAWRPEHLRGRWVLDAGCGAGRFAEVALAAGAKVVAMDFSSAVTACYANLRHHRNLHVIQGDIYCLPLAAHQFDCVYSLGVLQHTPDVRRAFECLLPMLKPGGALCVDFYERSLKSWLMPKYWLRPITKRMPRARLFEVLRYLVPRLLALSCIVGRVPLIGGGLKRLVPVANYGDLLPLNDHQQLEWALLDTFDWLAPQFDNPQSAATVRQWLAGAGLQRVEVLKAGHLVGRGIMADARRR